jgi:hypothetical protein
VAFRIIDMEEMEEEDKKIKIIFPDETAINVSIPEYNQDIINLIKSKIEEYICSQDYDTLMKMKRIVLRQNMFGFNYDMNTLDITDNKKKIDLIKLSIEKILRIARNIDSNEITIDKIVNEYVSFLILQDCDSKSKNIVNDKKINTKLLLLEDFSNKEIDDKSVQEEDVTKSSTNVKLESDIYLFQNTTICKRRANLLYSEPGVGKTLFSFEIAKCDEIKKPLFIMLDDPSGEQIPLCKSILKNKCEIISDDEWEQEYAKVKGSLKDSIDSKVNSKMLLGMLLKDYRDIFQHAENQKKQDYKQAGVYDDTEKLSNLLVLQRVIKDAVSRGVDFICIDTINGLKDRIHIQYWDIKNIIKISSDYNITLLVLHHPNSDGSLEINFQRGFPRIYKLVKESQVGDKSVLVLSEEKVRIAPERTIKIERVFAKDKTLSYRIKSIDDLREESNKKENLKSKIRDIIESHNELTISFGELYKRLGGEEAYDPNSVKNELKKLKNKSIIEMEKAGSWDIIRIL